MYKHANPEAPKPKPAGLSEEHGGLRNKAELAELLIGHPYDWLRDGTNKEDVLTFKKDGTYTTRERPGTWRAIDEKTLIITAGSTEFSLEFNADGTQGHLIKPVRDPPTRMIM